MNNFLNNFNKENYNNDEENEISSVGETKTINKGKENTHTSVENNSAENCAKDRHVELSTKKNRKKNGAFALEEITIDNNYYKYKYIRQITFVGVLIFIVIIIISIFFATNYQKAIDFTNEDVSDAQEWCEKEKISCDFQKENSNEVESDMVISQNYSSGEKIWGDDVLTLIVSDGPVLDEYIEIPNFEGKNKEDIDKFIEENILINATIFEENSELPKGEFTHLKFENEEIGTKTYTRGDNVIFYVSKGSPINNLEYVVDNFQYKNRTEVETWSADKGVTVIYKEVEQPDYPKDYVVSQSVEPGTKLQFGDTITIEISKGPGNATPSFSGLTESEAQKLAEANTLELSSEYIYSNSVKANSLVSQSIGSGESYYEGDSITLKYSLGKPYIDNMEGSSLKDVVDMINELNNSGANLNFNVDYVDSEEFSKGQVVSMSNYGEYVSTGTTIQIKVAN